jgi:hypothetical protein
VAITGQGATNGIGDRRFVLDDENAQGSSPGPCRQAGSSAEDTPLSATNLNLV